MPHFARSLCGLCATLVTSCMPSPDVAGSFADGASAGMGAAQRDEAREPEPHSSLVALTWNLEWLGDPREGPIDDARQLALAGETLNRIGPSLAGLQEVAAPGMLEALVAAWPGHAVVISSYAQRQQVALIYDSDLFELVQERTLQGYEGLDVTGRPPLELTLRLASGLAVIAIVLHAKAGDDLASWRMREAFAIGLHGYVTQERADAAVILLGDFNDLFSGSTVSGQRSPYEVLVSDGACVALTAADDGHDRDEVSTVWGATVDHVVLCGALTAAVEQVVDVNVLRDELLVLHPDFFESVSDHAPVSIELEL